MMNYYGWHMMRPVHPFFSFGWIFSMLFWAFIILLIVAIAKGLKERHNDEEVEDEEDFNKALRILKERYAKGELSNREFERMKKEIEK